MDSPVDLLKDPLADAPLTDEQRGVWETVRAELMIARERLRDQEARIRVLERASSEDGRAPAVLTRPEFNREVARMLAFDERYGGMSSVVYFDIENLKDIITNNGRAVADGVVRVICDTLLKQIRRSDILGRLAVDEFGVLLVRCDNPSAWLKAEKLANALQKALTEAEGFAAAPIISYGAYTFREKENLATGLQNAAKAVTRV